MPLELPAELQFATEYPFAIPNDAFNELRGLMGKVITSETCDEKSLIESYKWHMAKSVGREQVKSSNIDWAKRDLEELMLDARENGPSFVCAIYNAFEQLESFGLTVPSENHINRILSSCGVGCHIANGELVIVGAVQLPTPSPSMPETVTRALDDARSLSPASAIDRVHTALQAYLVNLCEDAGITLDPTVTAQKAFKELKSNHPALKPQGNRPAEVAAVLNSMAGTINALGTLRNHASLAHNNDLLFEPEARAMTNAAATVFHYIEQCIERYRK